MQITNEELCYLLARLDETGDTETIAKRLNIADMLEMKKPGCEKYIRKQIYDIIINNCEWIINYRVARYREILRHCATQDEEDFRQDAIAAIIETADIYNYRVHHDGVDCPFSVYVSGVIRYTLYNAHREKCGIVRIPKSYREPDMELDNYEKVITDVWNSDSLDRCYVDGEERPIEAKLASQGKVNPSAEDEFLEKYRQEMMQRTVSEIQNLIDKEQYDMLIRHDAEGEKCPSIGKSYGISRAKAWSSIDYTRRKLSRNEWLRRKGYDAGIIPEP